MTRTLKNPPIREAVIEIKFDTEEECSIDQIFNVSKSEFLDYDEIEKVYNKSLTIDFSDENTKGSTNNLLVGYIFKNTSNNSYLQIKKGSLITGQLSPYSNWNNFYKNFEFNWIKFSELFKVNIISRIGVRYINELNLPLSKDFNFDDYIKIMPKIPDGLPDTLCKYFSQIMIPCESDFTFLRINQNLEGIKNNNSVSIILDIDAYYENQFEYLDFNKISRKLDELRKFKNRAFFNSITAKTENIFNK